MKMNLMTNVRHNKPASCKIIATRKTLLLFIVCILQKDYLKVYLLAYFNQKRYTEASNIGKMIEKITFGVIILFCFKGSYCVNMHDITFSH